MGKHRFELSTNGRRKQSEWTVMNDKFDELERDFAQHGTRGRALKKFGVGLAGIALASISAVCL